MTVIRSSYTINGSHDMITKKTLNLPKIAWRRMSWKANTKIFVQWHTSKTTLLDLISFVVLKNFILAANFLYVGHNIEFQLLGISYSPQTSSLIFFKSNLTWMLLKVVVLQGSISWKSQLLWRIHDHIFNRGSKHSPSALEAHRLRIWSLVGFRVWWNFRTLSGIPYGLVHKKAF